MKKKRWKIRSDDIVSASEWEEIPKKEIRDELDIAMDDANAYHGENAIKRALRMAAEEARRAFGG